MSKRISIGFLLLVFIFNIVGCSKIKATIPGTSKEFNDDTISIIKLIEKDIKNKTNDYTCTFVADSDASKYLKKYDNKVLQPNEKEVIKIIKGALTTRNLNFLNVGGSPPKYDDKIDKVCITELEEIYNLK